MKRGALPAGLIASLLLLTACVTVETGPPRPAPDLKAAARINTQLGADYARQGDFATAETKLARAVDQDGSYAPARIMYGFVLARRGRYDEADKQYRKGLDLAPHDPAAHNQYGAFLCERGRYDEGQQQFRQALTDPSYTTPELAWTNAGVCAREAGDLELADHNLRQALQLRPENAEALAQIARVTFERKDWLRTRAFIERYERVASMPADLLYIAAITERRLGNPQAAQDYEAKLLSQFPESDPAAQLTRSSSPPSK